METRYVAHTNDNHLGVTHRGDANSESRRNRQVLEIVVENVVGGGELDLLRTVEFLRHGAKLTETPDRNQHRILVSGEFYATVDHIVFEAVLKLEPKFSLRKKSSGVSYYYWPSVDTLHTSAPAVENRQLGFDMKPFMELLQKSVDHSDDLSYAASVLSYYEENKKGMREYIDGNVARAFTKAIEKQNDCSYLAAAIDVAAKHCCIEPSKAA